MIVTYLSLLFIGWLIGYRHKEIIRLVQLLIAKIILFNDRFMPPEEQEFRAFQRKLPHLKTATRYGDTWALAERLKYAEHKRPSFIQQLFPPSQPPKKKTKLTKLVSMCYKNIYGKSTQFLRKWINFGRTRAGALQSAWSSWSRQFSTRNNNKNSQAETREHRQIRPHTSSRDDAIKRRG